MELALSESKIQTAKGLCVIAMTKHIMEKYNLSEDDSFAKLASLDFYKVFLNSDSGLYLEPNYILFTACDMEISGDKTGMYSFIQDN